MFVNRRKSLSGKPLPVGKIDSKDTSYTMSKREREYKYEELLRNLIVKNPERAEKYKELLADLEIKNEMEKIDKSFPREFVRWLCGEGTKEEHARTRFSSNRKPLVGVGFKETTRLVDEMLLADMRNRQKWLKIYNAGPNPENFGELLFYYKYIVRLGYKEDDYERVSEEDWRWIYPERNPFNMYTPAKETRKDILIDRETPRPERSLEPITHPYYDEKLKGIISEKEKPEEEAERKKIKEEAERIARERIKELEEAILRSPKTPGQKLLEITTPLELPEAQQENIIQDLTTTFEKEEEIKKQQMTKDKILLELRTKFDELSRIENPTDEDNALKTKYYGDIEVTKQEILNLSSQRNIIGKQLQTILSGRYSEEFLRRLSIHYKNLREKEGIHTEETLEREKQEAEKKRKAEEERIAREKAENLSKLKEEKEGIEIQMGKLRAGNIELRASLLRVKECEKPDINKQIAENTAQYKRLKAIIREIQLNIKDLKKQ